MSKGKLIDHLSDTEGEVSLNRIISNVMEYFYFLSRKWLLIFAFGLFGAVLGWGYSILKKPLYTASSTFVLEDGDKSGGGLAQYAGLASMAGFDVNVGGGLFQGDNIIELYKSRTMIEKTLLSPTNSQKKTLLIDSYITENKLRTTWNKDPKLSNIDFSGKFTRLQDSIIREIVADINKRVLFVSKPDKKLNILKVDVVSTNEEFAKGFNDQIVKNVNDFYIRTKVKKSLKSIGILQQKVDSVRTSLNKEIYSASSIADATPNLNPTRQTQRVAPLQRSQFSAETDKIILGELVKNLELSKITLMKETPLIQIIDIPVYPLPVSRLGIIKGAFFGGLIALVIILSYLILNRIFKSYNSENR
jgi:hypothetical protein